MKTCLKNKGLPADRQGFTLIELLVVIGILAVLLSIVLIAINPARQFSQANNTKRRNDVTAILNAIGQYSADNKGVLPADIPTEDPNTPDSEAENVSTAGADICADLVPTYISALPADPKTNDGVAVGPCPTDPDTYDTGYQVVKDTDGRVTVSANQAELSETISVTR